MNETQSFQLSLWLFTLSYLAQGVGSFILAYKIHSKNASFGVSIDTQLMLFVATAVRWIWIFDTDLIKLPFALAELVFSMIMSMYLVYKTISLRDPVYTELKGYVNSKSLGLLWAVASTLVQYGDDSYFFFCIAFTIFLESVALLPQLQHLNRDGDVGGLTSNYLFWLSLSRAIRLVFWVIMWERGDSYISLMLADLLHWILLGNFVLKYIQSLGNVSPILAMTTRKTI